MRKNVLPCRGTLYNQSEKRRCVMANDNDRIKAEMIKGINSGGAWFSTRENNYLKIGSSGQENRLYARECVIAEDGTMTGEAYSFGTDWFDISFHGRLVDIYIDPDSLKTWDVRYDREKGTYAAGDDGAGPSGSLLAFCRDADREALSGRVKAWHIDGAGFARNLEASELRMGRKKSILSLVDIVEEDGRKVAVTKDKNK